MPDEPQNKDAGIMEPPPQAQDNPAGPPEPKADPQRTGPPAPASAPAPPSAVQRPSTAPAPATPPPGQPKADTQPPKPTLVKIKYDGKEFEVAPEVAEVWQHRQEAFDSGYRKVIEDINVLKERVPEPAKPAEPTEDEIREQLATRLLTEPDKVFAEIKADIRKELTQEYQRDVYVREFQAGWWKENDELLPYKEMFDALLMQNANKYTKDGLSDKAAYDMNADALRKMILSMRGNGGGGGPKPEHHVEESAPGIGASPATQPAGSAQTSSISDVMRRNRERKDAASIGTTRATPAA